MAEPSGIEFEYAQAFARVVQSRKVRAVRAQPTPNVAPSYDAAPAIASAAVRAVPPVKGMAQRDGVPWIKTAGRQTMPPIPGSLQPPVRNVGPNNAQHPAAQPPHREREHSRSLSPDREVAKPLSPFSPQSRVGQHAGSNPHTRPPELPDRALATSLAAQLTGRKDTARANTHRSTAVSEPGGLRGGQYSARKSARRAEPTPLTQWATKNTARLHPGDTPVAPWVAPAATPGGAEQLCSECNARFETAFAAGEAGNCAAILQAPHAHPTRLGERRAYAAPRPARVVRCHRHARQHPT